MRIRIKENIVNILNIENTINIVNIVNNLRIRNAPLTFLLHLSQMFVHKKTL